MKRRNFRILALRKNKISNLNALLYKGGVGAEETETITGSITIASQEPTLIGCEHTETCETNEDHTCNTNDTTRTVGNNSFGQSCNAIGSIVTC